MNNKSAFEIIEEISSSLENDYLVKARSEGKKTIGFVCSFVPQEILTAAGAVPFRIRATGSTSTDKSEVYMAPTHCSFVRHTLNQALSGAYSFLDGVIFSITCDHSRRMYDNWKYADASPKFRYIMTVPHVTKQIDINGFVRDLKKMADVAAELTGQIVTIEKLRESIKLYDKQRDVILKINETRKSQSPSVTGLEMLKLYQSLMSIPVEDGIVLAEKFLEELQTRPSVVDSDALRFILSSSHYEDHKHLAAIESKKTIIVQDSGCIGSGHF